MSAALLRQCARPRCVCTLRFHYHNSYNKRLNSSRAATVIASNTNHEDTRSHDTSVAGPSSKIELDVNFHDPISVIEKKARKSAQKPENVHPRRNPLEPTKVDVYLASINSNGLEPTLRDLERCRPVFHSDPESPQYADEYHELLDTLCRSFSREQLRRFGELYNLDPIWTRGSRRKVEYAESIVEKQWNWPSLKEIERRRRDRTEVSVKSFNVSPSQLFLILGKDGADLLQLSLQYNVHISLTSDPLALRVEGLRGALKELSEHISSLKKGIIENVAELPTRQPLKHDMLQRISRVAGAYVENLGFKGKIRICAKDPNKLVLAKRLATRASLEANGPVSTNLLTYVPPEVQDHSPIPLSMFPQTYSMYPFMSPRSLPLTLTAGSNFRIRRVAEWLGLDSNEDISKSGGLSGGKGQILTTTGQSVDLKETLCHASRENVFQSRLIIASLGHLLLPSTPIQRPSLIPPLKGSLRISKVLEWLRESNSKLSFIPCSSALIPNSGHVQERILHRVVYAKFEPSSMLLGDHDALSEVVEPLKTVTFEVEITQSPSHDATSVDLAAFDSNEDSLLDFLKAPDASNSDLKEVSHRPTQPVMNLLEPSCTEAAEIKTNLMMPDRSMDVQISVIDEKIVAADEHPPELKAYILDLRAAVESNAPDLAVDPAQPLAPLMLDRGGETYILQANLSVRQKLESFSVPPVIESNDSPLLSSDSQRIHVVTEKTLDLESDQQSSACRVVCQDFSRDEHWRHFLAQCDQLTSVAFRTAANAREREETVDYFEDLPDSNIR